MIGEEFFIGRDPRTKAQNLIRCTRLVLQMERRNSLRAEGGSLSRFDSRASTAPGRCAKPRAWYCSSDRLGYQASIAWFLRRKRRLNFGLDCASDGSQAMFLLWLVRCRGYQSTMAVGLRANLLAAMSLHIFVSLQLRWRLGGVRSLPSLHWLSSSPLSPRIPTATSSSMATCLPQLLQWISLKSQI